MGINPCPYTKEDDKWESTHVHQAHFNGTCSHKIVGKRWDKAYETNECWAHIITKECSHNMVDNKWESTHVY